MLAVTISSRWEAFLQVSILHLGTLLFLVELIADYFSSLQLLLIGDSGVGKSCLLLRFAVSSLVVALVAPKAQRQQSAVQIVGVCACVNRFCGTVISPIECRFP